MRDGRPNRHPADNLRIEIRDALRDRNVVNRIIKQRNQPRDPNDRQRLAGEETEDHRRQCGREERLVDAEIAVRVARHVELEGQGGEQVDEEDAHGSSEGAVVEAVDDVAPVVGEAAPDVPVHAAEGARGAVAAPSSLVVPGVRVVG